MYDIILYQYLISIYQNVIFLLACASWSWLHGLCLLQVHRAVLHTGEAVVLKVQRPGLKNLFDIDLSNLKVLAQQMDRTDENNDFV